MARELTQKRKGFVKDYAETGVASLAVKKNFDVKDDRSARALGSELLANPEIQRALAERIPDDLLESKHLALLNKMNGDDIDVMAVTKGLDMAYKLKGSYAAEKSQSLTLTVEARLDDKDGLDAIRKEFEDKLKRQLHGS